MFLSAVLGCTSLGGFVILPSKSPLERTAGTIPFSLCTGTVFCTDNILSHFQLSRFRRNNDENTLFGPRLSVYPGMLPCCKVPELRKPVAAHQPRARLLVANTFSFRFQAGNQNVLVEAIDIQVRQLQGGGERTRKELEALHTSVFCEAVTGCGC